MRFEINKLNIRLGSSNTLLFFMTIVPLFTGTLASTWAMQNERLMRSFGLWQWLGITLFFTVTSAFALSPPTILALVYGYFLGWYATPFLVLLNMSAIALVYGMSQRLDQAAWLQNLSKYERVSQFLANVHRQPWQFVMLAKLSPILPFALTNLLFGLLKLPFKQVMAGGLTGMLPRTLLAVWVGAEAQQLREALSNTNQGYTNQIVVMLLVVVSVLGLIRFVGR